MQSDKTGKGLLVDPSGSQETRDCLNDARSEGKVWIGIGGDVGRWVVRDDGFKDAVSVRKPREFRRKCGRLYYQGIRDTYLKVTVALKNQD